MWTREYIKGRAKEVLRFNYWKAFVVSLVIIIAGGGRGSGGRNNVNNNSNYNGYGSTTFSEVLPILQRIILIVGSLALVFLLLRILLGYMIEVGGRKFFIKAAEGSTDMGNLGYCFKDGRYSSVLITMLLRDIYLFLWFLLFIIPGIVKSYSYRMVPYILADNPDIGAGRAVELSNQMTEGEKWNMFVLDLSFIGWYLFSLILILQKLSFI